MAEMWALVLMVVLVGESVASRSSLFGRFQCSNADSYRDSKMEQCEFRLDAAMSEECAAMSADCTCDPAGLVLKESACFSHGFVPEPNPLDTVSPRLSNLFDKSQPDPFRHGGVYFAKPLGCFTPKVRERLRLPFNFPDPFLNYDTYADLQASVNNVYLHFCMLTPKKPMTAESDEVIHSQRGRPVPLSEGGFISCFCVNVVGRKGKRVCGTQCNKIPPSRPRTHPTTVADLRRIDTTKVDWQNVVTPVGSCAYLAREPRRVNRVWEGSMGCKNRCCLTVLPVDRSRVLSKGCADLCPKESQYGLSEPDSPVDFVCDVVAYNEQAKETTGLPFLPVPSLITYSLCPFQGTPPPSTATAAP